jgi:hypothetical protein
MLVLASSALDGLFAKQREAIGGDW